MNCEPGDSCESCKCVDTCKGYSLWVKEQHFSYLAKYNQFTALPMEEAAASYINNRKQGENVYLVRC